MVLCITDEDLCSYNRQGIFPFLFETEKDFLVRVQNIEEDVEHFFTVTQETPPFPLTKKVPYHDWDFAQVNLRRIFDTSPYWIAAYYSKKRLPPWHPGMTWIFSHAKRAFPCALIQVRKAQNQEEILAHEAVHVMRMSLESTKYEEIFAYMTSQTFLRKTFGALFQTPQEANRFLAALFAFLGCSVFFPVSLCLLGKCLGVFCSVCLLAPLVRLFAHKRSINRAFHKLQSLSLSKKQARSLLFRLRDEEIDFFAKNSLEQIKEFVFNKKDVDLRWRQIFACYLQEVDWLWRN